MTNEKLIPADDLRTMLREAQQAEAAVRVTNIELQGKMLAYQGLALQTIDLTRSLFLQVKDHMTYEETAALQESIEVLKSLHENIRKEHGV